MMSFSTFPRHESFGPSTWSRSVVLNKKPSIFAHEEREPSHLPAPQQQPAAKKNISNPSNQKPLHINLSQLTTSPSLKSSLRSHSAPTTPTGSKTVKFNPVHLERICLFRKTQTPSALLQDNQGRRHPEDPPSFRVGYLNFPPRETTDRSKNILVEKKFIVEDNAVKGRVQVRNLAYHKSVSIRYTFDCWQTSHDIDAVYKDSQNTQSIYDTFCFTIPLVNLADRGQVRATIDFAIRYHVNGQEFWDNNDGKNYGIQILADPIESTYHSQTYGRVTDVDNPDNHNHNHKNDDDDDVDDDDDLKIDTPQRPNHKGLGNRYSFGLSLSQAKKVVSPASETIPPVPSVPIKPSVRVTKEAKPTMLVQPRPKKPEMSGLTTSAIISGDNNSRNNNNINSNIGLSARPTNSSNSPSNSTSQSPSPSTYAHISPAKSPVVSSPIPINGASAVRHNLFESYYHSAPSSPTFACQPRHAYIQSTPDLDSESYLDLVNKYCFYGTNSAHTPMPINS
ncbi:carbohydrate-binding module family 21 protein [Phycomyces blakesleeanus]|uniref:Carbohydrate-binding module family 21 protein n=2 Tax=Phycomyces blakesleeanus TaxID=4837 RepID=A0A162TCU2_PHYB8|nr:carbohydrate-binding module family 21 protein [Phycomyces blakesleeanus NRRL 1555(-)]OAD66103.1 carbohydrate-binding module family 21 protein [Phycomyces blakesleeanus NRRL 1555(-)]|eukprot:XP_018284143.1 carbohydrate-binding module family 21 protein [Phycomyces blakesleeanus NRRL 1555(-)]